MPWGVCFVCVVGHCKCIRCVLCVTAHPDIVAPLGTLSRAGLTWGTSLNYLVWGYTQAEDMP